MYTFIQFFWTIVNVLVKGCDCNNIYRYMLISILVEFLQRQLKYLKDNLKKCLDSRSKLTESDAPASSLPICNYFEVMRFFHDKTANKPTERNLFFLMTHLMFHKNRAMPLLLQKCQEKTVQESEKIGILKLRKR